MAKSKTTEPEVQTGTNISELAAAIVQAVTASQPKRRIFSHERKKGGPWSPETMKKLKRKAYHHGMLVMRMTLEEVDLFNKIRPGIYCNGFVKVSRRRDKGIDINYPVRTSAQKLRLVNEFGITSFPGLLRRLIEEAENPKLYNAQDDLDE